MYFTSSVYAEFSQQYSLTPDILGFSLNENQFPKLFQRFVCSYLQAADSGKLNMFNLLYKIYSFDRIRWTKNLDAKD